MFTRKRINIAESQLLLIWQRLLGKELITEEGRRLRMIYPGRVNGAGGPDFRDAVILLNDAGVIKGDVEIHIRSSDWYNHGHNRDPEYNNVILHVVLQYDARSGILTQDGGSVPVLCLPHELWHQAYLIPYRWLPCSGVARRRGKQALRELLNVAGEERFRQKAALFQSSLLSEEVGQVLFRGMMRAMGYSRNTAPFVELARRVPLGFMEGEGVRRDLSLKQAWLLGMAGLLPCQRKGARFSELEGIGELERIWQLVGRGAEAMEEGDWHLSRVYPNNSPVRRIVAQAYLLQRYYEEGLLEGMLRLVREVPLMSGHRLLEESLIIPGTGYWQEHFDIGAGSKTRKSVLLGRGKAAEMMVNVILPFAFAWGEMAGEPEMKRKAMALYSCYPGLADNEITRHMLRQFRIEGASGLAACCQQGLIHFFVNYCSEGDCAWCSLSG